MPQVKEEEEDGQSGHRSDCLLWILTEELVRIPFLNTSLVPSWLPPCICYSCGVSFLLVTQSYRLSLALLLLNT